MKIALLCGGPSPERGISLNSARSVLDHLGAENVEIVPVYFDTKKHAYHISCAQLYSNTPLDFDFKLKHTGKPLTKVALVKLLKSVDIVFPAMHGVYGEDGGIQKFLEDHDIPCVGSPAKACHRAFDKYISHAYIASHGFFTLPCLLLKKGQPKLAKRVEDFFVQHSVTRAVVKPAVGGSSIGVFAVGNTKEALEAVKLLLRRINRVVLEPFAQGSEFTTIILQNPQGQPVALPPTEIEMKYVEGQIFDFRKKYLPTGAVTWHCPPRFSDEVVQRIQEEAEKLFSLFGLQDMARFDGWVLQDGAIWFSDFNTVSGMEQNSFLFQQAARVGMTHADVLHYIVHNACRRYGISSKIRNSKFEIRNSRKPVTILFGGQTSERQVSLMSGTNVWLKLRKSHRYRPSPYLLGVDGVVWRIPYHLVLNHTIEEIIENCKNNPAAKERLQSFEQHARTRLGLVGAKDTDDFFDPEQRTLEDVIKNSKFIFNALHGGMGEDGTLQKLCDGAHVPYNGPGEKASRLCMDKWATSEYIRGLHMQGVNAIPGVMVSTQELINLDGEALHAVWITYTQQLDAETLIIKPRADGCSTGVAHLFSVYDFVVYLEAMKAYCSSLLPHSLTRQENTIEMPPSLPQELVIERFVPTDRVKVKNNVLHYTRITGWIEVTIGVIEVEGTMKALDPSITVAEGEVLSVEEKFQGGTGINITPPPATIMKTEVLKKVKTRIEQLAETMDIKGYSRIDAFVHMETGDLQIIEVNTLPGLTPSTVLYQQALAQTPPLFPRQLLELLIESKRY